MLAASPTLGPHIASTSNSTFLYSSSRNGKGAIPTPNSYRPAPMTTETASSRLSGSPARTALELLRAPHSHGNYQNASTQYSPMNKTISSQTMAMPCRVNGEEGVNEERTQGGPTGLGGEDTGTDYFVDLQRQILSPNTKRRQVLDPADDRTTSPEPQLSAPKRVKSSMRAPKVLPIRYEFCDVEDMVILIADMISELIETNDNLPLRDVVLTRFHSRTPPGISVIDYLQRLAKHAALTPPLLLSMVYYIDRLCSLYPAFTITTLTVHRFLITAATVAAKGLSDSFWNNSTYARVGGIKMAELGLLELEFLYRVDWRIVPNPEVLVDYYRGLVSRTEAYVIESENRVADLVSQVSTDDQTLVQTEADSVLDPGLSDHIKTDTKWEKWMRDVAQTSDIKSTSADSCDVPRRGANGNS